MSALSAMSVFSLRCRDCGDLVDIPGRFGFKLKNAGVDSMVCQRCRQKSFLSSRTASLNTLGAAGQRNRWVPALAMTIAVALISTLVVIQSTRPQPPALDQEGSSDAVFSR